MEVEATIQDTMSILRVIGYLDTRASSDFERKVLEQLQGGARCLAIDFTKLEMITSAGIRVLMMVVRRHRPRGVVGPERSGESCLLHRGAG
jgi:anti-sigma B factor antagonist